MSSPRGSGRYQRDAHRGRPELSGHGRVRVGTPRLPPAVIARPRLIARLTPPAAVTVLRAPSGFGKTVAVAQWLTSNAGPDGPAVWVRVDPALDPASFWAELTDLLIEAGVSVPPGEGPAYRVIRTAIRQIDTSLAIVVDGFDDALDSGLERHLIDLARYCPGLRLVVCLHSARHFPNSLRADIDTTIIESPELAFTTDEIAALSPAAVNPETIRADEIHRCTGGWPEPTRSVLLALHDNPDQSVEDAALFIARQYLENRVLPSVGQHVWLDFALRMAMPETLTDDVAQFVSDGEFTPRRLERLQSAGILSVEQRWGQRRYRWPEAARRVLREEFARRHPGEAPALHQRLACWYLDAGDARSAARHALQAGDNAVLIRVVEECWGPLLHHDIATLDEILAALPMESVLASPRATAARDIRMHLLGEVADAAVLAMPDPLPADEHDLQSLAASPAARRVLHTAYSMMVATRVRGVARRALDYAHRSEVIGRFAIARQPKSVGALLPSVMLQSGITKMVFGKPLAAERSLRLAYQTSAEPVGSFTRHDAAGKLALLHAVQGDPARAEIWLRRHQASDAAHGHLSPAIDRSALLAHALIAIDRLQSDRLATIMPLLDHEFTEEQSWRPFLIFVHARRCLIWGDRRGALRLLEDEIVGLDPWLGADSTMGPLLTAARVDLLLSLGLGGRARSELDRSHRHPALQPAAARLALLTGDDASAHLAMADDATHPPGRRSELLLLGAIARHRQGDATGAADLLFEARHTTRAAGSMLPFAMVPRAELRESAASVPEVAALLDREPLRSLTDPFGAAVTVVELTDRERRVLGGIADGGTLQQIAGDLFVSYNTVKTQVRSLYAKLGANSRSSALASAARHGLLSAVTDRR